MSEIENLKIGNDGTLHIVGNEDIVANAWAAGKTYVKNKSYVIREHRLYVCNVTHTSVEPFDATKWTEITVIGAIDNALDMTDTASGAIATFESEYALPLRNLEIEINAVQSGSGTPSPDNVRPITGFSSVNVSRTGKNLLPMPITSGSYSNQVTITVNDDKSFYISKPSGSGWTSFPLATMMLKKGTYTLIEDDDSSYNSTIDVRLAGTTTPLVDTRYTKRRVFPVVKDTKVDIIYSRVSSADNVLTKLMLFVGDTATATDYEPYNGTPVTISLGQTVYGGSLDVTTGVLTVDRASVTLNGSEEWNNKTGLANIFSYSNPSIKDWGGELKAVSKIMADTLPTISQTAMVKGTYGICSFSWGHQICVRVENISSAVDLKTYLRTNPLQAVYELATPVTYQLTPTQISAIVGTNNVFTDTNGDTSLEYYTKRGEQTVRIAEGVAVDVINNKNIDNLTTTNKTLVGAVNEIDKSFDFQTAKSVKFQVASGRLLIYLYTDDAKANGMRIDFDSSANVIELSSITNGTTAPTNRITFNHV